MYTKVNWQNSPSTLTALEAAKLNQMDAQYEAVANDIFAGSTDVNAALIARLTSMYGTDSGWIDITVVNATYTISPTSSPRYRKIGNVVFMEGDLYNSSAPTTTTAFTLPVGYRPGRPQFATQIDSTFISMCRIQTDGSVQITASTARTSSTGFPLTMTWIAV